ncbi:hypothetical protein ACKI1O_50855, partial [Streptomyces scabiei]
ERFADLYNPGLVSLERLSEEDRAIVQQLIYRHLEATESDRAREILADWPKFAGSFWKVKPKGVSPAPTPALAAEPATATAKP